MRTILLMFRLIPSDLTAKFFGLTAVSVLVGILEMAGVASVMPFVALMSDPSMFKSSLVGRVLPVEYAIPPIHIVGLVVLGLFVLTNLLGLLSVWLSFRFSALLGVRLSENLAESYFSKGYLFLRSQNPSILASNVTHETERVVSCGVLQLCLLVSKLIQLVLVIGLLIVVSPMFTTVIFVLVVGFYAITYGLLRARMARLGGESVNSIAHATREANELFAAAKELLLSGNFHFFIVRVRTSLGKAFKADAVSRMVQVMPKHVIELVAFSALLLIPIYKSWVGESYRDFLPVMALFAYAGYRILPSGQQVYASFSILKFYDTLAVRFLDVLTGRPGQYAVEGRSKISQLRDGIRLSQVSFCYPDKEHPAISGVSLTIKRHEKVAIIGPSGAGKSTLLDLLLGLLIPTSGELVVNGTVMSSSGILWDARAIGYVPQSPLMVRATIAQNIAFGVPDEQIDRQRCKVIAEFACVYDVVEKLPDGYDTLLGDGVSLSGGEIQRMAIARALYFSPDILVLDEPSSALDPIISARLFSNLNSPEFACTVVVVTHDWDILAGFDKIVVVDQGKVVAEGSFLSVREHIENLRKATTSPSILMREG
ncbi:MAG: ABC transporter ATP-binding protein [Nitrospirota bacterium]|nr:ABC transporter ATP-binding protein [Nitrospirota bacterium]